MNNKILAVVAVAILVVAGVGVYFATAGHDNKDSDLIRDYRPNTAGETFIDGADRNVTVPDQLGHGIVTIGSSGPLRFVSVFGGITDLVIETDKGDVTDSRNGRAYSYAYAYKDNVKTYHADNAISSQLVEQLGVSKPSLVVIQNNIYTSNKDLCDTLAKVTTVVVIDAQQMQYMLEDGKVASYLVDNYTMLGKVFGMESRATEVIKGIQTVVDDIKSLSTGSSDKKVYVAGVTISGSNSLNTTFPTYMPFTLTGVSNAYDLGSTANRVDLTVEQFTKLDIDMMVVDPSSVDKIVGNSNSQFVLEYVYGINNDGDPNNDIPIYVTVPIVWDSINYDCALASAYYVLHLVYGKLTEQEVSDKITKVFELFYGDNGSSVLKDMSDFFVIKASGSGQQLPMLKEAKIVKDKTGENYIFTAA